MSLVSLLQATSFVAAASSASADSALTSGQSLSPLESLSTDQVQVLLRDWDLAPVFGPGFLSNRYDGMVLEQLVGREPGDLAETLNKHFPNVVLPQWGKLVRFCITHTHQHANRRQNVTQNYSLGFLLCRFPPLVCQLILC